MRYEIWREAIYEIDFSPATKIGESEGTSFEEACRNFYSSKPFGSRLNLQSMQFAGVGLFPSFLEAAHLPH